MWSTPHHRSHAGCPSFTATSNPRHVGARGTAPRRHPWAELLRRVFGLEVLRCPACGGRRRILAAITQAAVIRAILESLGLPTFCSTCEPPADMLLLPLLKR